MLAKDRVQFNLIIPKEQQDFYRFTVPHVLLLLESLVERIDLLLKELKDARDRS